MKKKGFLRGSFLALLIAAGVLSSCTVGPDYERPEFSPPDQWTAVLAADLSTKEGRLDEWWDLFGDPTLTTLVDLAHASNRDLRVAVARIEEARAARGVAGSGFFPSIGANADYGRTRVSEQLDTPAPSTNPSDTFSAGFDASWEIDLFGRIRRTVEAAEADQAAAVEAYRDVLVTLCAEVALNYIELRTFEKRLQFARENVVIQEESLRVANARFDAGLVPRTDVTQALTNLNNTRAAVPFLQQQASFARNRLAVLVGGFPNEVLPLLEENAPIPAPPASVAAGLPAELIRKRPDIRQAERSLAGQTARIGIAEAELYPSLSLNGSFSLQASDVGDLGDSGSDAFFLNPSFRWKLFEGGAIRQRIKIEEARAAASLASYENTVLLAVEEVENALIAIRLERARSGSLSEAASNTSETVVLVKENYRNGLVDFQNVLDAERSLATDQDSATSSRGNVSLNYVRLFKALGGGAGSDSMDEILSSRLNPEEPESKTLSAFPRAEPGQVRHVIELPEKAEESGYRVELIVGKEVETDAVNRYFFGGQLEERSLEGWGYRYYELEKLGPMAGTLMAPDPDAPTESRFITLGGEPDLIRYNSRLPVVVYLPEEAELRYRIWGAGETEVPGSR